MHEQVAAGTGATLWPSCLDQLAQELPQQQFNTWIKPLTAQLAPDASRLTLLVANRFKLDWVRVQYAGRIATILEQIQGYPVQVELALAPRQMQHPSGVVATIRTRSGAIEPPLATELPAPAPAAAGHRWRQPDPRRCAHRPAPRRPTVAQGG